MSILSEIYKNLVDTARKGQCQNGTDLAALYAKGIENDDTLVARIVRKAKADCLDEAAAANLLLQGMSDDVKYIGRLFTALSAPVSLQTEFAPPAKGLPSKLDVAVAHMGKNFLSYSASPIPNGGYYLKIATRSFRGDDEFPTKKEFGVGTFQEAEEELTEHLYEAIGGRSVWNAVPILEGLTHTLR